MGAKRNINVTGTSKNSAPATVGGTFTHFQVFEANGTTPVTNPTALTTPQTIGAGGMLNIADAGIALSLGVAGSAVVGQLADAVLIRMLDAETLDGTEVIKFGTSAAMANSTDIAPYTTDGWLAASAF